jgi:hypothetical protein
MKDTETADAVRTRQLVARLRLVLGGEPDGLARAELRRRISSRVKHLYDPALDLLIAVGDVAVVPAGSGGTRYRLTASGQYAVVALPPDSEQGAARLSEPPEGAHPAGKGRTAREVQGDPTEGSP